MEMRSDRRCERVRMADDEPLVLNFSKKRKVWSDIENEWSVAVEFDQNEVSPPAYCSSAGYAYGVDRRRLRSPDLEYVISQFSDGSGREISMSGDDFLSTPTIEFCGDSEQSTLLADSSSASRKRPPQVINPPALEVEEFFEAAETHAQTGFAEKYNYDIAKDVPLEGRYQWVPFLP